MSTRKNQATEFLIGGIAACGAGFFTNPLEVVKTRMQLQGELKARGEYAVFYRNSIHAFYTIAKSDGAFSLQSGLIPALWYQFFMNGVRLGTYQVLVNLGMTKDRNSNISLPRSIAAGAVAGCIGASVGSPFYMVKTHLQSQATKDIAVGFQHKHEGMADGFLEIFKAHGITGLWRGVSAAMARVMVGSASQLSTFSIAKAHVTDLGIFPPTSWLNTLGAAMMSAVIVTMFMTPFDVVSTRLYNQGVDTSGKGFYYNGVRDCFYKIFMKEGLWGFYKGWGPSFLRLGPHTVLSLMFWDRLRLVYNSFSENM